MQIRYLGECRRHFQRRVLESDKDTGLESIKMGGAKWLERKLLR